VSAPPRHVTILDELPFASTLPATAPEQWLLAHIDIETTGLTPGYHEAIDVGLVLTDLEGSVVDSFFVRVLPEHPERLSPGAARVNGFSVERWRALNASAPHDAVAQIFAFVQRARAGRNLLLVAFNSQFDTAFLDHLLRAQGRSWRELFHYFVLDIPSMAWSRGYRDLTNQALAQRLNVPDEPRTAAEHTGITGAMLNVRIYRALMRGTR
jgi:DNA polymerase III epsilon subunit-like protein